MQHSRSKFGCMTVTMCTSRRIYSTEHTYGSVDAKVPAVDDFKFSQSRLPLSPCSHTYPHSMHFTIYIDIQYTRFTICMTRSALVLNFVCRIKSTYATAMHCCFVLNVHFYRFKRIVTCPHKMCIWSCMISCTAVNRDSEKESSVETHKCAHTYNHNHILQ